MKPFYLILVLFCSAHVSKADYWTPLDTSMQVGGICPASAFVVNSNAYVLGRDTGTNPLFEYDPIMDFWTQKANLPIRIVSGATGFTIGVKGYICLGQISSSFSRELWEYDAGTFRKGGV